MNGFDKKCIACEWSGEDKYFTKDICSNCTRILKSENSTTAQKEHIMSVELIESWQAAKTSLDYFKKLEMQLRVKVAEEMFEGAVEGTLNKHVGEYKVKCVSKLNRKLDKDLLADAMPMMTAEERACIVFKPELSLSKYKELDDSNEIDECITCTPATPTITVVLESK